MSSRSGTTAPTVDQTLAALRRRLPRWSGRRDLLREVRDGLEDARDAYEAAGLDRSDATARAIDDFGDLDLVARSMVDHDLARRTRIAAAVLGPGYVAVLLAWLVVGPTVGMTTRNHETGGAAGAFLWLGAAAVVTAVVAGFGLRRAARRGDSPRRWAGLVGLAGLICGATTLLASWLVAPWELDGTTGPWRILDSIEAFSGALVATMMSSAGWCLAASRRRAP